MLCQMYSHGPLSGVRAAVLREGFSDSSGIENKFGSKRHWQSAGGGHRRRRPDNSDRLIGNYADGHDQHGKPRGRCL